MRSRGLLLLLLLTVGCASIRQSARRKQPAQQVPPQTPCVRGPTTSAGQAAPTGTTQSDPTKAIAEVRKNASLPLEEVVR